MAHRILGLGDMLGLVDTARQIVDEREQAELEKKITEGQFTLDDFKSMLQKLAKPGLMMKMMEMMGGPVKDAMTALNGEDTDGDVARLVGIINSMTPGERTNPKIIEPGRRNRIAKGAGVQASQVNDLVKQYNMMAPIMQSMAGKGPMARMQAVKEMQNSGLLDPGSKGPKTKQGTGKRLTSKERAKFRKQREKELRRKKRTLKNPGPDRESRGAQHAQRQPPHRGNRQR